MSATDRASAAGGNGHGTTGTRTREGATYRDASLTDLLSHLSDDVTLLFRQEVELAKVEIQRELTSAGKAAGMLAAGAVLGFVTLLLLAWAAAWGLAALMPTGLAFLIVGVVFGAVAGIVAMMGKKRMQAVDLAPRATIETLQKDKQLVTDRRTG